MSTVPAILPLTFADKARDWLCPPGLDPIKDSQVQVTQDLDIYTVHIDPHGALWNLPGTRARFHISPEKTTAEIHVILKADDTAYRRHFKRPLKPVWLRLELASDADLLGWCAYAVQTLYNAPITFVVTPGRKVPLKPPGEKKARALSVGTRLKVHRDTVSVNNGPPIPHGEQLAKPFLYGDLEPDLPETL